MTNNKNYNIPDLFTLTDSGAISENTYMFRHDPIFLSVLIYETKSDATLVDLDKSEIIDEFLLKDDFLQQAKHIRDHFNKKLFYGALDKNFGKTNFRKELGNYLSSGNPKKVKDSLIGMIYRLPGLYKEDIVRKTIVEKCDTSPVIDEKLFRLTRSERVFSYITFTERRDLRTYWFKGPYEKACCFDVEIKNPFIEIWENYLNENKDIIIDTFMNLRHQDNFYFYFMMGPKIKM